MSIVRDASTVFRRSMRATLHNPVLIIVGVIQPFLYLFLFAPLLSRFAGTSGFGTGSSLQVFVPGLLVQQALISCSFVGFAIIGEQRAGVLDRMKTSPLSTSGILLGRITRDVLILLVQASLLIAGAFALGLRVPVAGVLAILLVLILVAVGASSLSYALALRAGAEDAFGRVINMLMLPVMLLSGVLLPMSLAPRWLADAANANPLSHVVTAARELFQGAAVGTSSVQLGLAAAGGVAVLSLIFGIRTLMDTRQ